MNEGRIRIGNQTAFSALTIIQPFEYAVENGFDAFEWFPDKKDSGEGWEESDLDAETRRYIKHVSLEHDIRLSVHTPWQVNPLKPNARERLLENLEFARDIGAANLNIHLYTDQGIDAFVEAILPFIRRLAQEGINLSIENTPVTGPEAFNKLFENLLSLKSTDTDCVGMCPDIGHANLCSATQNDYLKFMDMLDPQVPIIHIHMHENYGDYDSHLPLFTGPAGRDASGIEGLIERLKKQNFSGCIILEQWPQPRTLLNEARDRLRKMIDKSPPPPLPAPARHSRKRLSRLATRSGPGARHKMDYAPKRKERSGPGESDDFPKTIAEADRQYQSWREKLGWINDFLAEEAFGLNIEHLVYLAIYLRFIGTGEVSCNEDGRHYRPSHHARIASRIYDLLPRITTQDNVFIIRKIYPWLPSHNSAFTRAEPLTRIRDIAHRNDIPRELKQEIKHTLQNKLHRCAGPEDLVTSADLLEKITAPDADYPPSFVEEFKKFHEELKEFFGAHSLEEQLKVIEKKETSQGADLIRAFLETNDMANSLEELLIAFERLTELRGHLENRIAHNTGSDAQDLRLADIKLEDYSFVLLSQLINHFEATENRMPWSQALHALSLTVENLRLSGFDEDECQAVESELRSWRKSFEPRDIQQLIRLKASLDRCRRLAEIYCDKILGLFPERVERLGRALGVPEHVIKIFCEADIRGHLVFQLSKLVTLLSKNIRSHFKIPSSAR